MNQLSAVSSQGKPGCPLPPLPTKGRLDSFRVADHWSEMFARLERAQPIARFGPTWFHSLVRLREGGCDVNSLMRRGIETPTGQS